MKPLLKTDKETDLNIKHAYEEDKSFISGNILQNQVTIITGGDSGIGRAVAALFAKNGSDIVVIYKENDDDALKTKEIVEKYNRKCLIFSGDIGYEEFCNTVIDEVAKQFGRIDILINNAGEQHPQRQIEYITSEQLERTFRTNIFSFFYMTKACLRYMKAGAKIINTASVTAYKGSEDLIDYSSSKGAIVSFTRSLSLQLVDRGIRVNGVAPGPVITPLIPSTFDGERVENFGKDTTLGRPSHPDEIAPCYLFLAGDNSTYINGQFLHPNGGVIINC